MTTSDPAVSVVVPVRNEADNIAPLVGEIVAALEGQWPFEVVYVDDGSSDDTPAELSRLKAQYPVPAPAAARPVLRPVGGGAHGRRRRARAAGRYPRR